MLKTCFENYLLKICCRKILTLTVYDKTNFCSAKNIFSMMKLPYPQTSLLSKLISDVDIVDKLIFTFSKQAFNDSLDFCNLS